MIYNDFMKRRKQKMTNKDEKGFFQKVQNDLFIQFTFQLTPRGDMKN